MKGKIALFLHQPKCSVQSGNGIMQALEPHYGFKIFTRHQVEDDFFADVDIIAIPGGLGDAGSFRYLMGENGPKIRDFVAHGGRYLGICMGAYWAAKHYLDILDGRNCVQYIRRPNTDTRRPHAKALTIDWQGKQERMFFYDGCSIVGKGRFQTVATYANGDAMAGFQDRIGLIGCHPESEQSWYEEYRYMMPHWHQRRHHQLLLDFVDQLMLK
jgi:Biotin-protein ligase, N terminal